MIKDKFMKQIASKTIDQFKFESEPAWMTDFRSNAYERMREQSLPVVDKVDYHTWQFINRDHGQTIRPMVANADDEHHYHYISYDNQTIYEHRTAEMKAAGVILCDMATAFREHADLIKPFITDQRLVDNRLMSLQSAFMNGGVFIYVPKSVTLKTAINIKMIQNNDSDHDVFSRMIVVADQNSHFDVIQQLTSDGDGRKVVHHNVDIFAKANSNVQFFALDSMNTKTVSYNTRQAFVSNDANVDWMVGALNDGNTISSYVSYLMGNGSSSDSRVVSIANGRQVQGINTKIINFGKYTNAKIDQRGAITDHARLIFNGIGKVAHGAHGANNQQENHVLMLSDGASGDANPILLIDENDVEAGHAASIGKIDERQLYYLMSRGLTQQRAEKLVIRGFLGIILSRIPTKMVKDKMIDIIERKLANE